MAAASLDCALEDDTAVADAEASDQSGPPWHGGGKGRGGGGRGVGTGRGGARVGFNKVPRFVTVRSPGGLLAPGYHGKLKETQHLKTITRGQLLLQESRPGCTCFTRSLPTSCASTSLH
jgi:hypothetical protein